MSADPSVPVLRRPGSRPVQDKAVSFNPILVSVVVCTRNRVGTLPGMLASLGALRSRHGWEALIVDNASTDGTPEVIAAAVARDPRLRYMHAARVGLGAARDLAWRASKGEIVAFTDDDCYLAPDYIDALVATFAAHPRIGCLGGRILLFDPEDIAFTIDLRDTAVDAPPRRFLAAGTFHGANLAVRRDVLQQIGGFDPDLGAGTPFPCEDIDVVAASLWAGHPARFDPAVVVSHHHRRRTADIPDLVRDYDRGRGAYYAKYILRQDTRWAYLKGWFRASNSAYYRSTLKRFCNEARSAGAYFAFRRRYGFLGPLIMAAVAGCCAIAMLLTVRLIASRLTKLARRAAGPR